MPHKPYIAPSGEAYPSVTEVLSGQPKPWLERWKEKWGVLAQRKTDCANGVGSRFHELAEQLCWQKVVPLPSNRRLAGMLWNFEEWRKASGFEPKETELHVVSDTYKYHGTFDAVGWFAAKPKTLCLLDWKTSSGIYPDMALQLAAYAQAYYEYTDIKIKTGYIIHVSKDKPKHKVTVQEYKLTVPLLNKFLKRLREYRESKA